MDDSRRRHYPPPCSHVQSPRRLTVRGNSENGGKRGRERGKCARGYAAPPASPRTGDRPRLSLLYPLSSSSSLSPHLCDATRRARSKTLQLQLNIQAPAASWPIEFVARSIMYQLHGRKLHFPQGAFRYFKIVTVFHILRGFFDRCHFFFYGETSLERLFSTKCLQKA